MRMTIHEVFHGGPSPLALGFMIGGGAVAQVTPTTGVGATGLIVSLTGLAMALLQYFKVIFDDRQKAREAEGRDAKIRDLESVVARLESELAGSRNRHHDNLNRMNGIVGELEIKLIDERLARARLEGQLGVIDKTHAAAINTNAENIQKVAAEMIPPMSVPPIHVDPASGDDHPVVTVSPAKPAESP